jgi:isopenicillin N synthase-like dioxygenase
MNDRAVPVFALEEIARGEHIEQMRSCVTNMGVFYLQVGDALVDSHTRAGNAALEFFANASEQEKLAVTNPAPNMRRGFSPLGSESTAQCTNTGDYSDYAMVYSVGLSDNMFPSPDFERVWKEYFDLYYSASRETAKAVLRSVDAHLGIDIDALVDCDPVLRYRYFPDVPEDRSAELQPNRMAPHYDLSIVTLVLQTPCPNGFVSLQVQVDGQFVELPAKPGCIVAFCGSVAPLVSDGRIIAPLHQVVSPGQAHRIGSNRTSSALFLRPKVDFTFSVPLAKRLGMGNDLVGETATFGEWCGANYMEMHVGTPAA